MIDKKSFKLSILIPCYNEKNTIEEVLKKIIMCLKNYNFLNYEIIIVDDNSSDGTNEIIKKFEMMDKVKIFYHKKNSGKGGALHTAIENSDSDITIIPGFFMVFIIHTKLFLSGFKFGIHFIYDINSSSSSYKF